MEKLRIAITIPDGGVRASFITPQAVNRLSELGTLFWNPYKRQYTAEELSEAVNKADICVTGWGSPAFTKEVINKTSTLRMIAHTGGTVAAIISNELYDKGIKVISGNKLYAESTAEGAVTYMLTALRNLPYYTEKMKSSGWADISEAVNEGLLDQKVGLVGFGSIAKNAALLLKAFNTDIYAYDPYVEDEIFASYNVKRVRTLEELFSNVKIISLHLPLNVENYRLIDAKLLSVMQNGALFVNTARGACVDEKALAAELRTGRIKAVLDVFEEEPLPMNSELRGLDNVMLVPHMAGPTYDRRPLVTMALADDIERMLTGKPLKHEISYEYGVSMTNEAAVSSLLTGKDLYIHKS